MKKNYCAVFEVDFHIGELYFIIPILYCLRFAKKQRVCIIFSNPKIYVDLKKDIVLSRAIKEIPCDVIVLRYRDDTKRNRKNNIISKLLFKISRKLNYARMKRARAERIAEKAVFLFCHVVGKGIVEKAMTKSPEQKRLMRFPHSSGAFLINKEAIEEKRRRREQRNNGKSIIVIDRHSVDYWKYLGYQRIIPVGYYMATRKWIGLLESLSRDDRPTALIYSYQQRDDNMPRDRWEALHQSTYEAIRELCGDLAIVVKPHPNQDSEHLRGFIAKNGWRNVKVSVENPMLLAVGARFAISFLTSGIYNSLLLNVPSVNYYNARDIYIKNREAYTAGYSEYGIADVETKEGLKSFIAEVLSGKYEENFVQRVVELPTISTMDEFLNACS